MTDKIDKNEPVAFTEDTPEQNSTLQEHEKSKKRRKNKQNHKELNEQRKLNRMLTAQMAHALQVGASIASIFLQDTKWMITDDKESKFLAQATVDYLNIRFPDWKKGTPEAVLLMAFGGYFAKRLTPNLIKE